MSAILCRRRLKVPSKDGVFLGPQFFVPKNAIFVESFSSQKSSSDVHKDDPQQSFNVSYLINSCGLSSKDALSVSKKVCIKAPEKPDAVIDLLRKYGFTNSEKTLLPKPSIFVLSTRFPIPAFIQIFPNSAANRMNSLTASITARVSSPAAHFPVRENRFSRRSFFTQSPMRHWRSEPYLITKLESTEKTWKELSVKLADPDVVSNPSEYQKLAQSLAELDEELQGL